MDKSQAALIEQLFERLGAVAVTLGDAGDEPMLEPAPGETPLWQATRVTALFEGDADADALRSAIEQALTADIGRSLRLERLAERDWERAWLDQFAPMRFGERLWIRPSGTAVDDDGAIIVDLDPGLAFGTGTHPTTALCLGWLDSAVIAGKTIVDFGCGSGVLAVAALKLGAAHAIAVDHDPQALLATSDNARRNEVADRLTVLGSDQPPSNPADIVIANILANVLIDLAPTIGDLVAPGGRLVLSGILTEQADAVVEAYTKAFAFAAPTEHSGWVLLDGKSR